MLRAHVNQTVQRYPMSSLLSLAWLLLVLPLAKSALLISHAINKPNTQQTSDANDFVNVKSHACKRETVLARRLVQMITTVEENQEKWLLLIVTRFWADMPYKTDKKFNRNTLKLNSLSLKVLNVHFFPPRNIKPSNTKQTNKQKNIRL